PAFGRMDLLTVVLHELGNVQGLPELPGDQHVVMADTLGVGERRLPEMSLASPPAPPSSILVAPTGWSTAAVFAVAATSSSTGVSPTTTAPKQILDWAFASSGNKPVSFALTGSDWFETLALPGLTPNDDFWAGYAGK